MKSALGASFLSLIRPGNTLTIDWSLQVFSILKSYLQFDLLTMVLKIGYLLRMTELSIDTVKFRQG